MRCSSARQHWSVGKLRTTEETHTHSADSSMLPGFGERTGACRGSHCSPLCSTQPLLEACGRTMWLCVNTTLLCREYVWGHPGYPSPAALKQGDVSTCVHVLCHGYYTPTAHHVWYHGSTRWNHVYTLHIICMPHYLSWDKAYISHIPYNTHTPRTPCDTITDAVWDLELHEWARW